MNFVALGWMEIQVPTIIQVMNWLLHDIYPDDFAIHWQIPHLKSEWNEKYFG
jgi:hypothetical protein